MNYLKVFFQPLPSHRIVFVARKKPLNISDENVFEAWCNEPTDRTLQDFAEVEMVKRKLTYK